MSSDEIEHHLRKLLQKEIEEKKKLMTILELIIDVYNKKNMNISYSFSLMINEAIRLLEEIKKDNS